MTRSLPSRLFVRSLEERIAPAVFTVTNLNDSGANSLRDCVGKANAAGDLDIISFHQSLFIPTGKTLTLTTGQLLISAAVIIEGPGAGLLTLNGNKTSRLFSTSAAASSARVDISRLTLTEGKVNSSGGAIFVGDQEVTLTDCVITGNSASGHGGGVYAYTDAVLTLERCTVTNNTAGNRGGGFGAGSATATLRNCTLDGNVATSGGGIGFAYPGSLLVLGCTLSNNKATTSGGGGLLVLDAPVTAELVVRNSTVSGNSAASSGGGISVAFDGTFFVQNSTITANTAGAAGAGGGIALNDAALTLESTIVSGNTHATAPDLFHPNNGIYAKFSAVGSKTGAISFNADATTTALLGADFKLGGLANYGGSIQTHHPAPGSPLIGAGSNSKALAFDQRGFYRTTGVIDIGAVEVQQLDPNVTTDADSGPGSLRQAILDTNGNPGADMIGFDPGYFSSPRTITLTSGALTIADSVNIVGPGAALATISGNNASMVIYTNGPGILAVTLSDLTVTKSTSVGIYSPGENLTVQRCIISGNKTGMVVQTPGTLLLIDSQVTNNSASEPSTIGGVATSGGAIIRRSTISGNTGTGFTGGLLCFDGLTLEDSTVAGNTGGNSGGLFLTQTVPSTWLIRNSTISGNTAGESGGGIRLGYNAAFGFNGVLNVRNSTVTANKATTGGGGGISRAFGTGTISLESSIVSGNINPGAPDLYSGGTVNAKTSLIGSTYGVNTFIGDVFTNANIGANPLLGPLANNGGTTPTHAVLAGSPGRNNGTNPGALTNDQRGAGFPRLSGNGVDIGAFEVQPSITPAKVTVFKINDGTPQRSRVTSLALTFDNPLTVPGNPANAFQLKRNSDSANVSLNAVVAGNSVTLSFTGGVVDAGSLADGRYTLTILAAQAPNVDGNGDGTPGDNYVLVGNPATNTLFRLFGDADGDGDVDTTDFGQFRTAFGGSSNIFDFDNDGDVDTGDFGQFRGRFGATI